MISNPKLRVALSTFLSEQAGMLHRIAGSSMWPILRSGMVVRVESFVGEASPGDIVVYRTSGTLIAHRLLGYLGATAYRICGDAVPATIEEIARVDIIGRVTKVWPTGNISERPMSNLWFEYWGRLMVLTHPLRATIAKLFQTIEALVGTSTAGSYDFYRLVEATFAIRLSKKKMIHHIFAGGSLGPQLRCLGRHAMGGVFAQAWSEGGQLGAFNDQQFGHELRKTRIAASLVAPLILKRVRHLRELLNDAEISYILLKGAARLASGTAGAEIHHSTDVDVLIPLEAIDQAEQALQRAGYVSRISDKKKREYYLQFEHHRPPLWPSNERIPVELHTEIARPGTVSQHFNYAALRQYAIEAQGAVGSVWVLNVVGSALHLAYHARKINPWRDIYLLADLLKSMTSQQREKFDAAIRAERKHVIPLQSAVVAADAVNGHCSYRPATTRYLNWVMEREELPLILKHRSGAIEGIFAGVGVEVTGSHNLCLKLVRWTLNVLAIPCIVLWCARNSGSQTLRRWSIVCRNAELDKLIPDAPHVVFNDVE